MRRSRWPPFVLALVLAGCATSPEVTAWRMATEADSPAAYRDFTTRYPESSHAEEAKERLARAEQARVMRAATVGECVAISKGGDPQHAALAQDLAFKAAQASSSLADLDLFLEHFPRHAGAPAVRARLEDLDLERAAADPSPSRLEFFLLRYPGSRHEARARTLLAEKTYGRLKAQPSQLGAKAFAVRFPESPRVEEVRGWIRPAAPRPGTGNVQAALDEAVGRSRSLQRHACALALSAAVKRAAAPPDAVRRQLRDLERDAGSGSLPDACSSAGLRASPRRDGNLAEALEALGPLDALRHEQRGHLDAYDRRAELARAAAAASAAVADELETAELSEQVLGSGPLGNVEVGPEKGSQSARRALERLEAVGVVIRRSREEVARMLAESDGPHQAALAYVIGCVDAR